MKWSTSFIWAVPVWLVVCAAALAINFAAEARASLFDLSLALLAAYPVSAFVIKTTGEDLASWRAAYGSRKDENERR